MSARSNTSLCPSLLPSWFCPLSQPPLPQTEVSQTLFPLYRQGAWPLGSHFYSLYDTIRLPNRNFFATLTRKVRFTFFSNSHFRTNVFPLKRRVLYKCWTKWPPPLSCRREEQELQRKKFHCLKNDPSFLLVIISNTWMRGLAIKSCHCRSTAARKRSEKWEELLKPLWTEAILFHLKACMSTEMLSTSVQLFQMQRYINTWA